MKKVCSRSSCGAGNYTGPYSQDEFWGGAEPSKCGPSLPKNVDFLNLTPLYPPSKTPFFSHFVTKTGPFGRFGVVRHTPRTPLATGLKQQVSAFSHYKAYICLYQLKPNGCHYIHLGVSTPHLSTWKFSYHQQAWCGGASATALQVSKK